MMSMRPMTDEEAVRLANLLAHYASDSVREGASFAEVAEYSVREVVSDIVDATPQHLEHTLVPLTQDLT